ncbi:3-beta hydroxysteroid dehydrogenase/isomerase family protein [Saccharata proteae CBS 121410]|uniref:3-beta hydroxysteroid dehydrogenase/isomerase family protein n=1 Tax=Saccharata proteae CBS 121410 TaxID=1314787 RepID=A0A6A5YD48_9PEZI|nr:3-beta hydroxysteroid dehydrogenase/isomerase family protein [Saccharata proteae CBS 121410]
MIDSTTGFIASVALLLLYLYHVNRAMSGTPDEVRELAGRPWTSDYIRSTFESVKENPIDVRKSLPPKQGRRYIVVGGAGFLGSCIVRQLIARGEDISSIRVIDIRRPDAKTCGSASKLALINRVAFQQANITSASSVDAAFSAPWPQEVAQRPLTVFHTAAVIRQSERAPDLLHLSTSVNTDGTANVLAAAKRCHATAFILTSSGSVDIRAPNFWLYPWQRWPTNYFQITGRSTSLTQRAPTEYFGNYAISKHLAEKLVREADDPATGFRTGCIRPANGIFGNSGDTTAGNYLGRGGGPTWIRHIAQTFVYVENASLAHLLFEKCILDCAAGKPEQPDIGGRCFFVTDPNRAITFGDLYNLLTELAESPIKFVYVPSALVLALSYPVEAYSLLQQRYLSSILPPVTGDLAILQPALFGISSVHVITDDSEAKKPPREGGLGYKPPFTTLEAFCIQMDEWNREWADKKKEADRLHNGNLHEGLVGGVEAAVIAAAKAPAVGISQSIDSRQRW